MTPLRLCLVALLGFLVTPPQGTAQTVPVSTPTPLSERTSVSGALTADSDTLEGGGYAAEYSLEIRVEGPFEVHVTSTEFFPHLVVESPRGISFQSKRWAGSRFEARVVVSEDEEMIGRWRVRVISDIPGEVGTFNLEHRRATAKQVIQAAGLARADSLDAEMMSLYEEGRYGEAVLRAREVLAIREAQVGPVHGGVASSLNNLANLLTDQNDYEAARPLYERALEIWETQLGPEHLRVAEVLNNLGTLLKDLGEYEAARPLYERALATHEALLGPDHPEVARNLNNLATLLQAQGDYEAARPLYERALEIWETQLGPKHFQVALCLNNLGALLVEQGDPEAARPLLERALSIWETQLGQAHSLVAEPLNNLGLLYQNQGNYEAARPLFERALEIWRTQLGPRHPAVAEGLHNLGALLLEQNEPIAARLLLEQALEIQTARLGAEHPLVAHSLHTLAQTHLMHGDDVAARPLLLRSAHIRDRLAEVILSTLAPAEQRSFVDVTLGASVGLLLSTHREDNALAAAYSILGGWKGLLLYGLQRQVAVAALADEPEHADAVAELQRLRTQVARAYRAGEASLDSLVQRKETLERSLTAALPEGVLADPWRDAVEGEGGLGAVLPSHVAFVDLYRYNGGGIGPEEELRYDAVLVAPEREPVLVELGEAERVEALAAAWREAVLRGALAGAEAEALADAVWKPVAAALPPGTERVWVSPDGELARLPWGALAYGYGGAPLVAEVPSGRALAQLLFGESHTGESVATAAHQGEVLLVGGVAFSHTGEPSAWAPLPGTEQEVKTIARLAEAIGLEAEVMEGEEPTAPAVVAALPGAAYAHLATHGFFYGESEAVYEARGRAGSGSRAGVEAAAPEARAAYQRSPLVESGLVLAGGELTAEELVGLDLSSVRLVVLSACETGRGTEVTGQGVLGLRAAFAAAGARALLMSLWKVPDEATALLMEAFYRGLWEEGLLPAEALRRAQEEVRARPEWAAPVHWAAWTLSGEAW